MLVYTYGPIDAVKRLGINGLGFNAEPCQGGANAAGRPAARPDKSLARWQSGHAAACKAVYAGSIPTLASTILSPAVRCRPVVSFDDPTLKWGTYLGYVDSVRSRAAFDPQMWNLYGSSGSISARNGHSPPASNYPMAAIRRC
jgi:hypothetical protein